MKPRRYPLVVTAFMRSFRFVVTAFMRSFPLVVTAFMRSFRFVVTAFMRSFPLAATASPQKRQGSSSLFSFSRKKATHPGTSASPRLCRINGPLNPTLRNRAR